MKWSWRWMIGDYVPIESGMTFAERRRLLKPIFKTRVATPISAGFGGISGLMFASIMVLGRRVYPLPVVFGGVILLSLILNCAMGFFIARRIAPSIFQVLRERGIDLCSNCYYDLRQGAGDSTVCPECGRAREQLTGPGSESST